VLQPKNNIQSKYPAVWHHTEYYLTRLEALLGSRISVLKPFLRRTCRFPRWLRTSGLPDPQWQVITLWWPFRTDFSS